MMHASETKHMVPKHYEIKMHNLDFMSYWMWLCITKAILGNRRNATRVENKAKCLNTANTPNKT